MGRIVVTDSFQGTYMSEPFIRCTDLSFAWPDGTPVFRDQSFSIGRGRTGRPRVELGHDSP